MGIMLDVALWIGLYVTFFNLPEVVKHSIKIVGKVKGITIKTTKKVIKG